MMPPLSAGFARYDGVQCVPRGGDEAELFTGELLRMYMRFVERKGWKPELIASQETGIGGVKDAQLAIHGHGAYSQLKFEGGSLPARRASLEARCPSAPGVLRPPLPAHDVWAGCRRRQVCVCVCVCVHASGAHGGIPSTHTH